jgi:hypothetical protein
VNPSQRVDVPLEAVPVSERDRLLGGWWYRAPIYADDDDQEDDRQQSENYCNDRGKTGDLAERTTPSAMRAGEFGRARSFH